MPDMARSRSTKRAPTSGGSALRRLIVATAGDDNSVGALYVASALARRDSARVMALGVMVPFPGDVASIVSSSPPFVDEKARRELLTLIRARVGRVPATDRWSKRVVIGDPADVVNTIASSSRASMIIMGLGHHGRLDRLFGGETTIAVIRRARRPVLVVPPRMRSLPRHAVAAVDFTQASIASAALAANLLVRSGTLTIAHVCSFAGVKARDGDLVDVYRAGARAKLEEAVRRMRLRTRRRVDSVMLDGEPGQAILQHAHRARCDLIALGGHEEGLMDRIVLGSVRTRVVRGTKCSVLIAPPRVTPQAMGRR
jgi:nucleotide-binding universal stress UspA family protein